MATLLASSARAGAMPCSVCNSVGVMRMMTTMPAVSSQVSSMDTPTASPWPRSTTLSGSSATSSRRWRISSNTGVSASQRRRNMEPNPNTPPTTKGMRQANASTSSGGRAG